MPRSARLAIPARHFRGRFTLPGDKSISHRLAILGAMAEGETGSATSPPPPTAPRRSAAWRRSACESPRRDGPTVDDRRRAAPTRCARRPRPARRRQLGLDAAHARRASWPGGRSAPSSPATPRCGAGRSSAWPRRCARWARASRPPTAGRRCHDRRRRRCAACATSLPVRERPGEDGRPARRPAGRRAAPRCASRRPAATTPSACCPLFGVPVERDGLERRASTGGARLTRRRPDVPGRRVERGLPGGGRADPPRLRGAHRGRAAEPARTAFLDVLRRDGRRTSRRGVDAAEPGAGRAGSRPRSSRAARDRASTRSVVPVADRRGARPRRGRRPTPRARFARHRARPSCGSRRATGSRRSPRACGRMGAAVEERPTASSSTAAGRCAGAARALARRPPHRHGARRGGARRAEGETEIEGAECVAVSFPEFYDRARARPTGRALSRPSGARRARRLHGRGQDHGRPRAWPRGSAGRSSTSTAEIERARRPDGRRDLPRAGRSRRSASWSATAAGDAGARARAWSSPRAAAPSPQPETRDVAASRARSRSGCAATSRPRCRAHPARTAVAPWPGIVRQCGALARRAGTLLPPGRPGGRHHAATPRETWRARSSSRCAAGAARSRARAAMKYLILSDIHSNQEALTRRPRVRPAQALGQGGVPRRPRRLRRQPQPGRGHAARAQAAGGDPRQPRQGLLGHRGRRAVQPHRAARRRCGRARSSRRSNLQLAADAARRGPWWWTARSPSAHGTPIDEDAYIFGEIEALNVFRQTDFPLCFFGHSHFPVIFALSPDAITTDPHRGPVVPLQAASRACAT